MTNSAASRRPKTLMFVVAPSSLGFVLVAHSGKGIVAVLLGDDRDALRQELEHRFPDCALTAETNALDTVVAQVIAQVENPAQSSGVELPIDLHGSPFQRMVWQALREIPVGTTATYSEIAVRIGRPTSARAVAGACAANPVAVLVPCHRVISRDGGLSGYRWGVERKRLLLQREAAARGVSVVAKS